MTCSNKLLSALSARAPKQQIQSDFIIPSTRQDTHLQLHRCSTIKSSRSSSSRSNAGARGRQVPGLMKQLQQMRSGCVAVLVMCTALCMGSNLVHHLAWEAP